MSSPSTSGSGLKTGIALWTTSWPRSRSFCKCIRRSRHFFECGVRTVRKVCKVRKNGPPTSPTNPTNPTKPSPMKALEYAIRSLLRKRQTEKEIRERIQKRHPEANVEEVVTRLKELNYINDEEFSEACVRH